MTHREKIDLLPSSPRIRLVNLFLRTPHVVSAAGRYICLMLLLLSHGVLPASAANDVMQLPSLVHVTEVPSTRQIIAMPPPIQSRSVGAPAAAVVPRTTKADFAGERASAIARQVADWVVESKDNGHRPFVIVDKVAAQVFVFETQGKLRGAAPVLLGLARGDDTVPGIGKRKLASIRPEERTTPAGRFVATLDRDLDGQEVLWVDYDAAISMHRVLTSNPKERRLQRLSSDATQERRISYGCINVPAKFYDSVLSPAFKQTDGIVYVLPDTVSVSKVFAPYGFSEPRSPEAAGPVDH